MVDLHHHLLPGLDDGSPDLATSVAMARIAAADGITHVVCTPHASGRYSFQPERVAELLGQLRAALADAAIPLTLGSGCDFHLSFDNIQDAQANPKPYTINHHGYLLIELPDHGLPPTLSDTYYRLQIAGLTLILTHPERNPTLQRSPERLRDWVRNGVLLQVTADSVTGAMGKPAQKLAQQLLDDRWVHFLATDAHDTLRRPPRMSAARDAVAKRCGPAYADLLCTQNPLAVFEGRALPPQPELRRLWDDDDEQPSFFKRLFGRG